MRFGKRSLLEAAVSFAQLQMYDLNLNNYKRFPNLRKELETTFDLGKRRDRRKYQIMMLNFFVLLQVKTNGAVAEEEFPTFFDLAGVRKRKTTITG